MGSDFIFVEDHVRDPVDDRVLSLTVGADEFSLDDMGLNLWRSTSRMILWSFRSYSSFSRYSGVRSLGKLVSPISVTVLCNANQSSFLTSFLMFYLLNSDCL